jgi:hypothetical protein
MSTSSLSRRNFVQLTAFSIGAISIGFSSTAQLSAGMNVALLHDPNDPVASAQCVTWAIQEIGEALDRHGFKFRQVNSLEQLTPRDFCIIAAGKDAPLASPILRKAAVSLPNSPEGLALIPAMHERTPLLLAAGSDARGLMYALLELTDRVKHTDDPARALTIDKPIVEEPFNAFRGICRPFVSDVEDKPWFYDREMWPAYFAMLATQRFNRFHLALGLGYDFLEHVTDAYLLFAYPFLLSVPGYDVRAVNLPDAERDRTLEMLQYISQQAVAHGIDFHLGLWTHGYQWADSPNVNYTIAGLTPQNQSAYCRDALALLLQKCPDISGVTLRTHYESGVREGNYGFWKTVFDGIPRSGRKLQIDLHTKGLDQQMIDNARATEMPLMLSPKYWAEHMGMPYQQAAIRDLEMPGTDVKSKDYSTLSEGSRIFTRYGYADFLTEERPYKVMFRVFPGTHRFLLWGDPVTMASHSRSFQFCGSNGAELFEPLSFKGRRGSGLPGGRCAYADTSLKPQHDWEKYLYTYRVWGRLLYNPDADPEIWRRQLRHQFPATAPSVEVAIGAATRILPIITTAHLPSAAHDTYWPEMYTNQSMFDETKPLPYGDTPSPKTFSNVSPLDPQMFSRIADFADALLKGEMTGKYSPIEVAQWLQGLVVTATNGLSRAEARGTSKSTPEFRRMVIDVQIQIGLGRFFATKLHSGTLYAIYQQSGDRSALEAALNLYRQARELWSQFAGETKGVYVTDITYGPLPHQRGDWLNRLPAMDADIAGIEKQLASFSAGTPPNAQVKSAIEQAQGRSGRTTSSCVHTPPARFVPGTSLEVNLAVKDRPEPASVRLYYRHVDQAERYQAIDMEANQGTFRGVIPASYTASKYPLQYYFELRRGSGDAWLFPAFAANPTNTPYFVVRSM